MKTNEFVQQMEALDLMVEQSLGYEDAEASRAAAVNEAYSVARDMRKWMKDHRWLKELEEWATRLETL